MLVILLFALASRLQQPSAPNATTPPIDVHANASAVSQLTPHATTDISALARRADALAAAGDLKGARDLRQQWVEALERSEPETSALLRDARKTLGGTFYDLGDLRGARRLDEQVLDVLVRTREPNDADVARARANLGGTLIALGEIDRALEMLGAAVEVLERALPRDNLELLGARNNLASALQASGESDAALVMYAKILPILEARGAPNDSTLLAALNNTASVSMERGDFTAARTLFERVLAGELEFMQADHPKVLDTRLNLCAAMEGLGDLEGARSLAEDILRAHEKSSDPGSPALARARGELGSILLRLRDWGGAAVLARQALEDFERELGPTHKHVRAARTNLANVLRESGDLEEARELLERAIHDAELELGAESLDLLTERMNLALVTFDLGRRAEAIPLLEAVVAVRERNWPIGDQDLLLARRNLAWALAAAEQHERLAAVMTDLIAGEFAYVRDAELGSDRAGDERIYQRDTDISMLLSFDAMLPPEMRHTRGLFELIEECRARAVASDRIDADDPKLAALYEQAREARSALAAVVLAATTSAQGEGELTRAELDRLVSERDAAERALRAAAPRAEVEGLEIDAERLVNALAADERVFAFRRYMHYDPRTASGFGKNGVARFAVHVLAPKQPVAIIDLGDAQPMLDAVDGWRATLEHDAAVRGVLAPAGQITAGEERGTDSERAAALVLRERILVPLNAALTDAKVVHVVADDAVLGLPLDVLPVDEERKVLLGDRALVLQETSLERLTRPAHTAHIASPGGSDGVLVALGGVDYDDDADLIVAAADVAPEPSARLDRAGESAQWAPLPATGAEAVRIATLFEVARRKVPIVLDGARATREALEALLPRARYLHVATHGFFAADVRFATELTESAAGAERALASQAPRALCGLVLAGANGAPDVLGRPRGLLSAEEIAGLDLSGCELAVLSACETGFGMTRSGMGFASLQSALHAAGARTVIASLWKVDDAATRELFESFYRRIWVEREPKARALWNAKMELRARGRAVREWAAWILTGDPN